GELSVDPAIAGVLPGEGDAALEAEILVAVFHCAVAGVGLISEKEWGGKEGGADQDCMAQR
ncbi:hypothetical protein, partial [endosymbiont of Ridgeia piscesae]